MDREALGDVTLGRYDVEVVITKFAPDEEIAWTVEGRFAHVRHIYGYRLEPAEAAPSSRPTATGRRSVKSGGSALRSRRSRKLR